MSRPLLAAAAAAAMLAVVGVAGCSTGAGTTPLGGGLLTKRQSAPSITAKTLDGSTLSLASLKGEVVVVNFYAQWCGPCRAEAGTLRSSYAQTKSEGVDFVGVNVLSTTANGRAYLAGAGLTYPSWNDPDGVLITRFKNVNARGIPYTFVMDRTGKVAARWLGPIKDEAAFVKVINTLAAEPA